MTDTINVTKDQVTSFVGPNAVNVYAMRVLSVGLEGYAKYGIVPNRAYTPTAMLQAAERWTGKKFKRGQYFEAAQAVRLAADDLQREKVTVVRNG